MIHRHISTRVIVSLGWLVYRQENLHNLEAGFSPGAFLQDIEITAGSYPASQSLQANTRTHSSPLHRHDSRHQPMDPFSQICACGRSFTHLGAFKNHQNKCVRSRSRLSTVLSKARDVLAQKRKPTYRGPKVDPPQPQGTINIEDSEVPIEVSTSLLGQLCATRLYMYGTLRCRNQQVYQSSVHPMRMN
jgi:hypothetical protein